MDSEAAASFSTTIGSYPVNSLTTSDPAAHGPNENDAATPSPHTSQPPVRRSRVPVIARTPVVGLDMAALGPRVMSIVLIPGGPRALARAAPGDSPRSPTAA